MTSCHSSDRIGQVGPTERQDVTKEPQSDQTERVNAPHQELELTNLKSRISKVDEMEQGRTAADDANEFSMSVTDERIALATLSWALFLEGWNDGTIGPVGDVSQGANLLLTHYSGSCSSEYSKSTT